MDLGFGEAFIDEPFIEEPFIDEPFIECIDELGLGDPIMWLLFIDDELFIECMADGLGFGEPDIESAIAGAAVINAAARIAMK